MKTALIIDGHPVIHIGCRQMLAPDFDRVESARSMAEALAAVAQAPPDLALLDLALPDGWGLDLAADLRARAPACRILVFSAQDKPVFAARALKTGVHGFLSKDATPEAFRGAVACVMSGDIYLDDQMARRLALLNSVHAAEPVDSLTERERRMLQILADGGGLRAVALGLEVSYKTAANLSAQLKRKLSAQSLADLIRLGLQQRYG
ncbi:response regulator [Paenirhodobacter sp.]|uniref:response regulator n=1 Tax=Paenirhodobacter sp. TaxID=1965326 RepID=UPI003B3EA4CC